MSPHSPLNIGIYILRFLYFHSTSIGSTFSPRVWCPYLYAILWFLLIHVHCAAFFKHVEIFEVLITLEQFSSLNSAFLQIRGFLVKYDIVQVRGFLVKNHINA